MKQPPANHVRRASVASDVACWVQAAPAADRYAAAVCETLRQLRQIVGARPIDVMPLEYHQARMWHSDEYDLPVVLDAIHCQVERLEAAGTLGTDLPLRYFRPAVEEAVAEVRGLRGMRAHRGTLPW